MRPGASSPAVRPELGSSGARQIGARRFDFHRRVAVMAIVNRTRDSFFDRGRTFDLAPALAAVDRALDGGADWIDIGGVPFSPTSEEVDTAEEIRRVVPVVAAARARSDAVISVDTFRVEVARAAVEAGATAINDTSGLRDPAIADLAAATGAALVITHSKAAPRELLPRPAYADVVGEVRAFLADRAAVAVARGVRPEQVIVDPGHDLNKNTFHSLELTRRLAEFADLGFPLLASVSNKDFIGETLGLPNSDLREGTVAALVLCVLGGARIVRVHDVATAARAVRMVEAVLGWREPVEARHNLA
ncbi:MAG: dihydropteroate synthase [Mycobacteriales bacterium]